MEFCQILCPFALCRSLWPYTSTPYIIIHIVSISHVSTNCCSWQLWMEPTTSTLTGVTVFFQERALNACKGSETYTLQRGTCNAQVSSWHRSLPSTSAAYFSRQPWQCIMQTRGQKVPNQDNSIQQNPLLYLVPSSSLQRCSWKNNPLLSRFVLNLSCLEKVLGQKFPRR